jgi:serine/threonine-protein kinase
VTGSTDPLSLLGQMFGQFRVGRVLPGSRSGLLYSGWDLAARGASGQQTAVWLRFFDPEYARHTDAVVLQAEAWGEFAHERYLPITGHGTTSSGGSFVAMQPCDGALLCERFTAGRLEVIDAVKLALAVGEVLVAAHAKGLVHLGISDEAVVVPRSGDLADARLLGFGIRAAFERVDQAPWHYLAPEQQLGQSDCDERADVYALGLLLYRCLTGEFPIALQPNLSVDQLWRQLLTAKRRALGPMLEAWFERLAGVVERAIERDRDKRFQTSVELMGALRSCDIVPLAEIALEKSEPKGHVVAPQSKSPEQRAAPSDRTLSPTPAPVGTAAGKVRPKTLRMDDAPAEQPSDGVIGLEIHDVRIESALARGGMGAVYLAKHVSLGRTWVVKVADIDVAPNAERWFRQEALITAALREKGERRVPEVRDVGKLPDGRPYMVMEFVPGRSLSDVLKETPKLSFVRALKITARVCDTLERAHDLGFVHRDIKPTNIMIEDVRGKQDASDVRVLDWGVAKGSGEAKQVSTLVGMVVGTPGYMAPEATLGEQVDGRTDVFSVACCLYEMLAGRTAFVGDNALRLMDETRNTEPPLITTLRSDVPPELRDIVHLGLARHVENRPTMAQFRARLEQFMRDWSARQSAGVPNLHSTMLSTSQSSDDAPLARQPTQAAVDPDRKDFRMRAVAPDTTRPNRVPTPRRSARGPLVGLAVIGMSVIGAAGYWFATRPPPPQPSRENTVPVAPPAEPSPAIRVGKVRIVTTPPKASVLVDGAVVGETPFDLTGKANELRRVTLKLDGYADRTEQVELAGGVAEFTMKRSPPADDHHRSSGKRKSSRTKRGDGESAGDDNAVANPFGD